MDLTLPLRALQALFLIIVLGLAGYAADKFDVIKDHNDSPSEINFLIFTAIWTILALLFLLLTPKFLPSLANKFIVLGVEALTTLFWFAGFVALAVYLGEDYPCNFKRVCYVMRAACVFAAFEWLLWTITTILNALKAFRGGAKTGAGATTV